MTQARRRLGAGHAAVALAVAYFVVLWITAPSVGFTRDEGYYFKAAEQYARWWGTLFSTRFFEAFSDAEILRHFSYNTEHPPLVKLTLGVTYHLLHEWLGVAGPSQAFRASGFFFAALSLLATFMLGRALVSSRVGLLAALLLASMPRYFFDAHLACFDVAITAMWAFALYAFHRAYVSAGHLVWRRSLQAGVVFGLALATKLNALFLPFVFVLIWLIAPRDRLGLRLEPGPSGGRDVRLPPIPVVLLSCAVVGPLVFIATWPYLWHETFARIGAYIGFHLHHEHYPIAWFHELLVRPPFPWSFPLVMSAITVPVPVFVLGCLGYLTALVRIARGRRLPDTLLVVGASLPVFLIAMPSSPIFGGVKHWYNALPFLSILAARAVFEAVTWARARLPDALAPAAATAAVVLAAGPGVLGSAFSHPNGIGFYNALAGGFRGGAELGMQRGFWGGLAGPLYHQLDDLRPGGRIFFNRTNYDSYRMYRREGTIPQRSHYANSAKGADVAVHFEQPEHGEKEGEIWSVLGTRPVSGVYQDNVTLIQLYRRGQSDRAP